MMRQYPGYVDQPGLQQALGAAGVACWWEAGGFYVSDLAKAQSVVAAYDPLPAVRLGAEGQVQATLAAKLAAGFVYSGVLIDCSQTQTDDITAVAAIASNILTGKLTTTWTAIEWPSMNGAAGLPIASAQDMVNFGAAIGHYVSGLKFYALGLISQIRAATTAAAVQAIDLTTGWPTS